MENAILCPKCQGKGRIKKADGTITICFDCLQNGNMDQHDKNIRDSKDLLGSKIY
jgi:hypothetical protein